MAKAIISDEGNRVTFIQLWTTPTIEDKDNLLSLMKEKMGMYKLLEGFVSMTLHPGLDGKHLGVYAQWESSEAFEKAVLNNPAAKEARKALSQFGVYSGSLCTTEFILKA